MPDSERGRPMRGRKLLILGAGQYGFVAAETAQAMNCFEEIAFLDDANPKAIGKLSDYEKYAQDFSDAFVAMGNPKLRLFWLERLAQAGFNLPVLIHPQAWLSPSAQVGPGVILEPMTVVHANSVVKRGCLLCAGAIVNHNAVVEEGCQIDCGAIVMSNARVEPETKIPCGTVVQKI